MSGHSHFATIKRQKAVNDAAKGNVFSKITRAIMIAAKGGADPDMNFKLRFEMDKARAVNMPKENIERAIAKATAEASNLTELTYEGFGPGGIGIIIEATTDNKNRSAQEVKNTLDKGGGSLGGPNAVAFNFDRKGFMLLSKNSDPDAQMLTLIDFGVEDIEDAGNDFEIYVSPDVLGQVHKKLTEAGFSISQVELQMKPKNFVTINDVATATRAMKLIEDLESLDDVQKVFTNLDIPEEVAKSIT